MHLCQKCLIKLEFTEIMCSIFVLLAINIIINYIQQFVLKLVFLE